MTVTEPRSYRKGTTLIRTTPKYVLARPACEWCASPYKFTAATVEIDLAYSADATARVCASCAAGSFPDRDGQVLVPVAEAVPLLSGAEAAAYVESQEWTTARTVPEDPHQYLLLRASTDPWTHLRMIRYIGAAGERRLWPRDRTWYSYWRSAGHEYWGMPRESETLINRRVVA